MRTPTPLIATAVVLALGSVAFVCSPAAPRPAPQDPGGPPSGQPLAGARIALADYLPTMHAMDGSVDYSPEVRQALAAAAGGELLLPSYPVRVSVEPGRNWCVRVTAPTSIVGTTGSALWSSTPGVQLLRAENVAGLTLCNFEVVGTGGHGRGLAHGLVQITGGSDISVDGLRVRDSDADGIAVALVERVHVTRCRVTRASKSSLYASACRGVIFAQNFVDDFGGHTTGAGDIVGVGIQLSSCEDVLCADNVIDSGVGAGILCNANAGRPGPRGNTLRANRIRGVRNGQNYGTSGGIRLANGAPEKFTQTVVAGNSIVDCGVHGIFIENHDGALVTGNTVAETDQVGILVSTSRGVVVARNVITNSGTSGLVGLHHLRLLGDTEGAVVADNVLRQDAGAAFSTGSPTPLDSSASGNNALLPRRSVGSGPPSAGSWAAGDIVHDVAPGVTGPVGWICVTPGTPGTWRPFGGGD